MKILEKNSTEVPFQGDLGTYRPLITKDGSLTFYSEHFQEAFHSTDGAEGETRYNFVEGCEIASRAARFPPSILEVGLGMGRGYPATLRGLGADFGGELTFVSVERDEGLIDWCRQNVPTPPNHPGHRDLKKVSRGTFSWWEARGGRTRLLILPGNAVQTLPRAKEQGLFPPVNSIYQDAFSPGKNPELWTPGWFRLLKSLASPEVILSTYSASPSVREALTEAGFTVEERKGFGRKRAAFRGFVRDSKLLWQNNTMQ